MDFGPHENTKSLAAHCTDRVSTYTHVLLLLQTALCPTLVSSSQTRQLGFHFGRLRADCLRVFSTKKLYIGGRREQLTLAPSFPHLHLYQVLRRGYDFFKLSVPRAFPQCVTKTHFDSHSVFARGMLRPMSLEYCFPQYSQRDIFHEGEGEHATTRSKEVNEHEGR